MKKNTKVDVLKISSSDAAKIEYEQALNFFHNHSQLRRQGIAFVTTVEGAMLTIIGNNLVSMEAPHIALSVIGFFVALLGINNERRLIAFTIGYLKRARKIESVSGMSLLYDGYENMKKKPLLVSNTSAFVIYYVLIVVFWISVWLYNFVRI